MPALGCPHCGKSLAAPASAAPAFCPHCQTPIEAPATSASRWFLARAKKKLGPYTQQQLAVLAKRGELTPDDMLLPEGAKKWHKAAEVPRLFDAAPPTARPSNALLITLFGSAALVLLFCVSSIGGFLLWNRKPAETKRVQTERKDDAKKTANADPPGPPKQAGDGPKKDETPAKQNPPKEPSAEPAPDATVALLAQLNRLRTSAGLGAVMLDDDSSRGCLAHAKYLARHRAADIDLRAEDANRPGYTGDGARAAQVALIALAESTAALDQWLGGMPGRLALLDAQLRTVGVGVVRTGTGEWIAVVDAVRGRGEPIVIYPAQKQSDVPLSFGVGPELPDRTVAGFPITITFPPGQQVVAGTIELRDEQGNAVDGYVSNPEKPTRFGKNADDERDRRRQRNSIALIPKTPLRPATSYQVKASAQIDGKPRRFDWSFTTEDDADTKGIWAKKALAKVNAFRAAAGLNPVSLDVALSQACLKHARYLIINEGNPALEGLKAHDEDLRLPGASVDGRTAGLSSDISIGDFDPLEGVDAWMATLYHRVPILEPHLERVGFACARARRQGWVTLLNLKAGTSGGDRPHAVFYPADNQRDVPLNFPNGGEIPNPIPEDKTGRAGYPITAFFPRKAPLQDASGKLTDAQGNEVPCWFSSPEKLANPNFRNHQGNTVCLIPKEPLRPNTTFHVHIQGKLAGRPWQKDWTFTTGDGGISSAAAKKAVLDRINHHRALAGLAPASADPTLSRGCQFHADYLMQNRLALAKSKFSPNDEDPLLPGYTAEGLRASRQSDVFTDAPTPIIQIEDIMSTFSRRVYLLDPALQRIGYGCAHDIGRGWRCVLDLNGGRGDSRIILFPAPNQTDVPTAGLDPSRGFPISISFPNRTLPQNAQAVLTDAAGKSVQIAVSTPQTPLLPAQPPSTVAILPTAALQPGQTYSITAAAIINGSEWRQTWQFTTRR